ncbi:MAG TPA: type 4a pilus biogenesis protein PilO [Candidatus Angelobacter sp.]|jgi:type IV pilus assembly protein PilO|nr:type 4a pilus biogenesis protein PilO [Candidatus Angelobacter sp.]
MAKFSEMSLAARAGILFVVALLVGIAYYYVYFNPKYQENQQLQTKIKEKTDENATLRTFEPKLVEVNRNMAILQQQLEIQKKIVPDEKDADQFIKLLHDTAATSGIDIRRYTAMPVANKEFYSEVPFAIDIDGPYYRVLDFFQRVAELERIVNVGNMQMANTKNNSAAKVRGTYTWKPNETVLASCTATTFFSHEPDETASATSAKPGQPAPAKPAK